MLDQKDYIREQISKVASKRKLKAQAIPSIITIPTEDKPKFVSYFLLVCVILMCVAIPSLLMFKNSSPSPSQTPPPMASLPPQQKYMTQADADKLVGRVSWLEKSLKDCSDRVWVLGIAQTENTNMNTALTKKYFPQEPSDYIFIESDWKLSREPRHLKFEEKQKEKLQPLIK